MGTLNINQLFSGGGGGATGSYPGMLPQARLGGGMPFEQGLGLVSPLMGMLGSALNLDERMLRYLAGPGMLRYGGSFTQDFNQSNVLLNQWQSAALNRTVDTIGQQQVDMQRRFHESVYKQWGFSNPTAEARAQRDVNTFFSPMEFVSGLMMQEHRFDVGRTYMKRAALNMGVMNIEPLVRPGIGMSDEELAEIGMGSRAEVRRRHTAQVGRIRGFHRDLTEAYKEDAFGFGGLDFGDVGAVENFMARAGGLRDVDMTAKKGGNKNLVDKVRGMSETMSIMQELFGGAIPELLGKVESIFGPGAGAMSSEAMSTRLLQMKHTSQLTGQSMQNIMNTVGVSQRYLGMMGDTPIGGMQVALDVSAMLGRNFWQDAPRMDAGRMQEETVKYRSGIFGADRTKTVAGAYLSWIEKTGRKDDEDSREAFQKGIARFGSDVTGLSRFTGIRSADIEAAGRGEAADIFREKDNFASLITLEAAEDRLTTERRRELKALFRNRKIRAGRGVDIGEMSYDEIEDLIEQQVPAGQRHAVRTEVQKTLGGLAERLGFSGGFRAHEKVREMRENLRKNEGIVKHMAELDLQLNKKLKGRRGFRGLMETIEEGDMTVGGLVRGVTGIEKLDADVAGVMVEKYDELMEKYTEDGVLTAKGAALKGMFDTVVQKITSKAPLTKKETEMLDKLVKSGDIDELETNVQEYFKVGGGEQGRQFALAAEAGLGEELTTKGTTAAARKEIFKKAAIQAALKKALTTNKKETGKEVFAKERYDAIIDAMSSADTQEARLKILEKSGMTTDEYAKFEKEYAANKDLLGINKNPMETILERLITALDKLVTKLG